MESVDKALENDYVLTEVVYKNSYIYSNGGGGRGTLTKKHKPDISTIAFSSILNLPSPIKSQKSVKILVIMAWLHACIVYYMCVDKPLLKCEGNKNLHRLIINC